MNLSLGYPRAPLPHSLSSRLLYSLHLEGEPLRPSRLSPPLSSSSISFKLSGPTSSLGLPPPPEPTTIAGQKFLIKKNDSWWRKEKSRVSCTTTALREGTWRRASLTCLSLFSHEASTFGQNCVRIQILIKTIVREAFLTYITKSKMASKLGW